VGGGKGKDVGFLGTDPTPSLKAKKVRKKATKSPTHLEWGTRKDRK